MGFRDLLEGAIEVNEKISVFHEMFDYSEEKKHQPIIFNNIAESPNHRASLNILTRERICASFGISPGELIDILSWAMKNPSEPKMIDKELAPVMENTQSSLDLSKVPIPWHYKEDGGRYQSASIIVAEYDNQRNISFHRQLLRDKTSTVSRFVPRHLRTMTDKAWKANEEMPIAVVNGADPLVLLSGAMSFNEPLDEMRVASSLHQKLYGRPLEVFTLDNGIVVPSESEYVMEACITMETDDEGPYVDITGTVDDIRQEPVIRYSAIHHRTSPVFHAIIPAQKEHYTLMGLPRAPTIKTAVSEVVECTDVYLTEGGCGWLSSVVQIVPKTKEDGKKAIHAALDGHKSMKQVIVVDKDIDVSSSSRVEWALMTRWQPDKDTVILSNQKGSSLDPSRSEAGETSKIGMDATIDPNIDKSPYESVL
ncbi:MAG: hypothetical protein CL993_04570 [Euryarchaeota archaeon]|nr:hypothetical protein [Euryarchaeota archaeon]